MIRRIKDFLFKNASTRQTIAKNTFWLAVSNIGGRLLRAVIIIYAARILGAAEWGIFSYAISLVTLLTVFTDLGVSPVLVREAAKLQENPEKRSALLSASFALKFSFLAVGVAVVFIITPWLNLETGVKALLPIAVTILIFDTLRELGFSFVRALEKMEWEAGLYLATNVAIVAFGFLFLWMSKTVVSFTYAYAVGTGLGMVATFFALRKYLSGIFSQFSFKTAKYILSSGWPFAVSAVLSLLMVDTDIVLIGWLRSAEEVGLYSAAQRVAQLFYILPSILATSLLPTFSRLVSQNKEKIRLALERVLALVYILAIPIAVGGVILGGSIIELLFGGDYSGAASSFQILIAALVINFPATILGGIVFIYNKQKYLTIYAVIGSISNVALDFTLIPLYGIAGSAAATFLAQILSNAYLWHMAKKFLPFSILPQLKKTFGAVLPMALIVFILKLTGLHVLGIIALGALTYIGILYLLKEQLLGEIKSILRLSSSGEPKNNEPRV